MTISLVSINGNAINDGTNFQAIIPEDNPLQAQTNANFVERYQNWGVYSHKQFPKFKFSIVVAARAGSMDNLAAWFDTGSLTPVALVGSEGGVQYYRMVTPELVQPQGSSAIKVILACADPVWKAVNLTNAAAWNITASGQTTAITVGGTRYTEPTISLAISSGAGWAYKRFVLVRNRTSYPLTNYPIELTGGGLNTSTLVGAGKMQTDGDDWRLIVDGVEWPRWFDPTTMNTSSTKLWTALDYKPGIDLTLGVAIPSSGAVSEITFAKTNANAAALKALPSSGLVLIDNEIFLYTSKNETNRKVGGSTRAQRGSSMAAHNVGATVYWIEHDIQMIYGNASATAPVQDDSRKPVIDLANSTNTSWVYAEFLDTAGTRAGRWNLRVSSSSGNESRITTGDSAGEADPATSMGMEMNPWQKNSKWQTETATILATLNVPGGIASITANGQKRRMGKSFPSAASLQRSSNGSDFTTVWNETTPTTAGSFVAWNRASSSMSNNRFARFLFKGSVKGGETEQANFEVADLTAALTSGGVPLVTLGAETSQNWVDFLLENTTTGDSFEVTYPMTGSVTLVIDCEARTITAGGENIFGAIRGVTGKDFWMRLARGSNTLRITGSVGTMTASISYRERRL